jgi:hypothetical protein
MRKRRSSMPAGTVVTRPDGAAVTLPKDWEELSIEELITLGLGPGQGGASRSWYEPGPRR